MPGGTDYFMGALAAAAVLGGGGALWRARARGQAAGGVRLQRGGRDGKGMVMRENPLGKPQGKLGGQPRPSRGPAPAHSTLSFAQYSALHAQGRK